MKSKETYSYGLGRNSYVNNETQERFDYLTNQSGSVTGLVKNNQSVAQSQYQLYGGFKQTTDTSGNPFHYNGEARDVTGLDYLRARYYDSGAGTFLTQDTYLGSLYTPLIQNLYAYVKNNPVNYTDPSGHFWHHVGNFFNSVVDTVKNVWDTATKVVSNAWDTATKFVSNAWDTATEFVSNAWHATTNVVSNAWQSSTGFVSNTVNHVKATVVSAYEHAKATGQAVYDWGVSTTREAVNIARNWTKSLEETIRHVCETAERIVEDPVNFFTTIDWGKVATTAGNIAGELFSVNDIQRLVTGVDPITGEEANRWEAAGWLALDIFSLGTSKVAKGAKVASKADDVADVIKGAKAADKADDVIDVAKVVDKADDVGDAAKIADKTEDVNDATKVTSNSESIKNNADFGVYKNKGYNPKSDERTFEGDVKSNISADAELSLYTKSPGFNNKGVSGGEFKRIGVNSHGGISPHVHQPQRNISPIGDVYGSVGRKTGNGGVKSHGAKDVKQLYDYLINGKYRP